MSRNVFWPSLVHGGTLEKFCSRYLPETFADLELPFAAIATELPSKRPVTLKAGKLAAAINASCAIRVVRRPVLLDGERLKDGGISCVLPSITCRELGADFVIASDVWEFSALLRAVGLRHTQQYAQHAYPDHYIRAVSNTDILIQPPVPLSSYLLVPNFIDRLIDSGETAARRVLSLAVGWNCELSETQRHAIAYAAPQNSYNLVWRTGVSDNEKFPRWLWPLGLAVAGLGTTVAVLTRGCWHTRMSWPIRHDEHFSYRVCTSCGAKRLFDHSNFLEYGPYGYDLEELIARTRARNIKRIHQATAKAEKEVRREKKRAS